MGLLVGASSMLMLDSGEAIGGIILVSTLVGGGLGYWFAPEETSSGTTGALLGYDSKGWQLGVPQVAPGIDSKGEIAISVQLLSGTW